MSPQRPGPGRGTGAGRDLRLFRVGRRGRAVTHLPTRTVVAEKSLQSLIERHLLALLGVRFLASEYATGVRHGGRIDTLGIDGDGRPVVIEYKRTASASLVSQGLFYLDWLDDHRAEFRFLVQDRLGPAAAAAWAWKAPRLICIAAEFHRYDIRAVHQISRGIELVQYQWFADDLLSLTALSPPGPQGGAG